MVTTPAEEILSQIPMDQLASQLGVDESTAEQAVRAAVPTLIGGLQHNADAGQEGNIAGALLQHEGSSVLGNGNVNLADVDTDDGQKIVHHIFGDQSGQLATALGSRSGADSSLISKLLPILAPIVLAYLAQKINGQMQSRMGNQGGILGDILGQATGQQQTQQAPSQAGGGILGGILGSILGGGGLGSILGGGQEQSQAQQGSPFPTQTQGSPFNPPQQAPQGGSLGTDVPTNDPGQLRVDDTPANGQLPGDQQQEQNRGGVVDDILGGIFGRGR